MDSIAEACTVCNGSKERRESSTAEWERGWGGDLQIRCHGGRKEGLLALVVKHRADEEQG